MNSRLNAMFLLAGIKRSAPDWKDTLADVIGAPRVFHRFKSARVEDGVMFVDEPSEYAWIKLHHQRDLAKVLNITQITKTTDVFKV